MDLTAICFGRPTGIRRWRGTGQMTPAELLNETIEAHGGRERWGQVGAIKAALSSGGLAFQSRCQPNALKSLAIEVRPHDVAVTLGISSAPDGAGSGRPRGPQLPTTAGGSSTSGAIRAATSAAPFSRSTGTSSISSLSRATRSGTISRSRSSSKAKAWSSWARRFSRRPARQNSTSRFGPDVPTHSERQSFHIDAERRLVRHDYTAEPIGSWATGANLCLESEVVGGDPLLYAAKGVSAPRTAKDGRPVSHSGVDRARRRERRLRRSR